MVLRVTCPPSNYSGMAADQFVYRYASRFACTCVVSTVQILSLSAFYQCANVVTSLIEVLHARIDAGFRDIRDVVHGVTNRDLVRTHTSTRESERVTAVNATVVQKDVREVACADFIAGSILSRCVNSSCGHSLFVQRRQHALVVLLLVIVFGLTEVSATEAPAVGAERKADPENTNLFVLIAALIAALAAIVAAVITRRGSRGVCESLNFHYHFCACAHHAGSGSPYVRRSAAPSRVP